MFGKTEQGLDETTTTKTSDWKGKEVEWSSKLGIGNMQLELNNNELANEAFTSALEPIESLMMEVSRTKTSLATRHCRDMLFHSKSE